MGSNQKARNNPKTLHTLDSSKRGLSLMNSLTGNLHRFRSERAGKAETLQEIFGEMGDNTDEDQPSDP
jgi:hypothetical protein